jgi:hypothetical protein
MMIRNLRETIFAQGVPNTIQSQAGDRPTVAAPNFPFNTFKVHPLVPAQIKAATPSYPDDFMHPLMDTTSSAGTSVPVTADDVDFEYTAKGAAPTP